LDIAKHNNGANMSNKVYEIITNKIIDKIESGELGNWIKSWSADYAEQPKNPSTKTQYRGINYMLLQLAGFSNPNWMTFKQISAKGGRVKKGEKSTMIIYYKKLDIEEEGTNGETVEKSILMLKGYLVFNADQCENLPAECYTAPVKRGRKFSNLLDIAQNSGFNISLRGNRTYYTPASDSITMPEISAFNSVDNFESVLLHELTHLTGHETRLNRLKKFDRFGSSSYAFEELVAELGSAFACAKLGIQGEMQHAEYLNSWLQVLRKDKKAIFSAASHAQKACDWLIDNLKEKQSLLLAA